MSMRGLFQVSVIAAIVFAQIAAAPQKEPYVTSWYLHPQRLVDVGGRRMNIICTGKGSPTVILEAGGNSDSTDWRLVQAAIGRHTRVCSYDRAGMGFSDPTASPRDAGAIVRDLHALLHGARISPPYVLVGWSSGALYVRLYTDRYPNEVAGLVLVDPASEYYDEQIAKIEPTLPRLERSQNKQFEECAVNVSRGKCAFAPGGLAGVQKALRASGCPHVDPADCAVAKVVAEHALRPSHWRDVALEFEANSKSSEEVRAEQISYGNLPLIVLTESEEGDLKENKGGHDPIPLAQQRAAWILGKRLHDRIAALSSRGINFVIAGSEHAIQIDHPFAVISAVDEVEDQARYSVHPRSVPGGTRSHTRPSTSLRSKLRNIVKQYSSEPQRVTNFEIGSQFLVTASQTAISSL